MLDYAVVAGALLGKKAESIFHFDSLPGYAWVLIAGIILVALGYLIKGWRGSFITLLIGAVLCLYINDFFLFRFY